MGLRLNLSEQPDVAIVTVTHALAAQIFYVGANAHVVGIQPVKTDLATHAVGIEDTPAGKEWSDRHANWARQMPRDVAKLWEFVVELDHDSRMALFAHCAALTVNAVKLPFDLRPRALAAAGRLAGAVALDMTGYWRPTVQSYLGRVTKAVMGSRPTHPRLADQARGTARASIAFPQQLTPAFFPCRQAAAFLAGRQKSRLSPSSAALRANWLRADRSPGQGSPSRLR